ncbi:MAG: D-hexose-6-phosphate mutarotase [Massilia sp.]
MSTTQPCQFGQLPAVEILAADGARAIVTLFGAHLVSWKSADGQERLFCSSATPLDGSAAIRGGVPVIFPQFNQRGPGMRHGFARVSTWRLIDSGEHEGDTFAVFGLEPADLTADFRAAWPHTFALRLRVAIAANRLEMSFEVDNGGADDFSFSVALHTYHAIDDIDQVRIDGVQPETLAIGEKLDQIFFGIGGEVVLDSGAAVRVTNQSGFTDAVVWNPGAAAAAALSDLADHEYKHFVCIEPSAIDPVPLAPGAQWRGVYQVRV